MEGQSFVSDAEWKTYLSTAYAEMYAALVETGLRYYEKEHDVTTTGTASYKIPDDLLSLIGVDYNVNSGNGETRSLQPMMVQERNMFSNINGTSEAVYFAMVGPNLTLYPKPPSAQVYTLVYVPQPLDISSATDSFVIDVVTPDGESFLIWHMAFRALAKEESDTVNAKSEREDARGRLYSWAVLRMLNEPQRVITQDNYHQNGYREGDYWGRGGWF